MGAEKGEEMRALTELSRGRKWRRRRRREEEGAGKEQQCGPSDFHPRVEREGVAWSGEGRRMGIRRWEREGAGGCCAGGLG